MAVAAVTIVLDEHARRQLTRTARSARAPARDVLRTKIVLAAAGGLPNTRIAARLQIGVDTVRKWRGRFAAAGLAGLSDDKRSGRPRRHTAEVRVAVIATATRPPTQSCCRSTRRPRSPPAPVNTPAAPVAPGRPARQEFEYVRHGTVSIVAALDVRTGQTITEPIGRNDSVTFQRFLTRLDTCIDPGKQIHIVLDNGSSHVARATRAWLAAHPRWHVHWTPVHASWLNQIEMHFSALTRRVVRHGDFPSREDLINKIDRYAIEKNTTAKPYRWTYDGTPLKAA